MAKAKAKAKAVALVWVCAFVDVCVALSWSSLGLGGGLGSKLVAKGLPAPTDIQERSIPRIASGEDVLLSAATGTGKTLAYAAVPVAQSRPTIVIAPTQFLCEQIRQVVFELTEDAPTADESSERARRSDLFLEVLRGAPRCAVVTPKDILFALERRAEEDAAREPSTTTTTERTPTETTPSLSRPLPSQENASSLCLILDEADALLRPLGKYASEGAKKLRRRFPPPGVRVVEAVIALAGKNDTQLVAASATVGRPLKRLLERLISRPVHVVRSTRADAGTTAASATEERRPIKAPAAIDAHYLAPFLETKKKNSKSNCPSYYALEAVEAALRATSPRRCLVVLARPEDDLKRTLFVLRRYGFDARALFDDADDSADDSAATLGSFRQDSADKKCLFVAPLHLLRGIDVPKLDLVLILGRPRTPDDYLHAVGRAGRVGHRGLAVTLAPYADVRVLDSWSTQLDLHFDKVDNPPDLPPISL
mmetsp:Transcript_27499/g.88840  ORF Transcript_27499/g.88840 Transcript_27499/m.88840 type:complete len:481 (+) Transcript_27499:43-1485(+)